MEKVDVIVPVKNEEGSIFELVKRIHNSLNKKYDYRIIFVDDHSDDGTYKLIISLQRFYPVELLTKQGLPGKAYSILEASRFSKNSILVMIDGDLQYPPEAIPEMIETLRKDQVGVVVANRKIGKISTLRKIGSKLNRLVFERLLHGFDCDTQSGLKVYRHEIIDNLSENDVKAWTIDMPLLKACLDNGYKIATTDIHFNERTYGESKINFFKAAKEIAIESIKLKFKRNLIKRLHSTEGTGYIYKNKKYITHSELDANLSAIETFTGNQKTILFGLAIVVLVGLLLQAKFTLIAIVGLLSTIYLADFVFTLVTIFRSLRSKSEISFTSAQIADVDDSMLPVYTILCPLYKESEVLPQFVEGIERIDWPKDKLEVLILLEQDDVKTINTAYDLKLPSHYKIIIVPDSQPKTKPKACNYGLNIASGEFLVIYDAEDNPDPLQLKKAYLAFNKVSENTICLQSKLNYYNQDQNLLTRLFTSEYSFWFDIALPGLQSFNTIIPLGGTSNHFRTSVLKELHGWDAFNVTEDCDLGTRLFKRGYKSAIIDSVTLEEANSNVRSWIKQRSRWIKGYMQTYFVHMRDPIKFFKSYKLHALLFQLIIAMRMVFILINPFLWLMTLAYFTLYKYVGPQIQSLYPSYIYYIAVFTMVFGNFTYFYSYMVGLAKKEKWSLIVYVFFIPFYWMLSFVSAFIAFRQLITKPYYWEKTKHGLHLETEEEKKKISLPKFIPEITIIPTFELPKLNFGKSINSAFKKMGLVLNNRPSYSQVLFDSKRNVGRKIKFDFISESRPVGILTRVNKVLYGGGILILANLSVNILNYVFNAFLGRVLSFSEFGSTSLMTNAYLIVSIFTTTLSTSVTYKSAYLLGKRGGIKKDIWKRYRKKAFLTLLPVSLLLALVSVYLFDKGLYQNNLSLYVLAPTLLISAIAAVDGGFLAGNHKFNLLAVSVIIVPIFKLIGAFTAVLSGKTDWIYYNQPLTLLVSLFVGWFIVTKLPEGKIRRGVKASTAFPVKFYLTTLLNRFTVAFFLSADVVLVSFLMDPISAGKYAILSLCGKMVYFLGSIFPGFVTPIISKKLGEGKDSLKTFYVLFVMTCGMVSVSYLFLGILGRFTAPILFGNKAYQIIEYLPYYTLAIAAFTLATTIVTYHQVRRQFTFSILGFLISAYEVFYILNRHSSIEQVIGSIFVASLTYLFSTVVLHVLNVKLTSIRINLLSFIYLFKKPYISESKDKLNILIFNWRDINHKWAGGAEVYAHEIAQKWVKKGYGVTIFCSNDGQSKFDQVIKGVKIVRRGGFFSLYIWAAFYYLLKYRGKYDFIVDCENGIPFFTPLYCRLPKILLIHHVHQKIFRENLIPPFSHLARFLEGKLMPYVYRFEKIVTISESSRSDIEKQNISQSHDIGLVNPGINLKDFRRMKKYESPTFLYLGRLMEYKNVDVAIKAFKKVIKEIPNAKFIIAGRGGAEGKLKSLTEKLGLSDSVEFWGFVNEKQKCELLARSWVCVQPSTFEGWGITVVEANASGTPVIASDTNGLRDSVADGLTGILVPVGNVSTLAKSMVGLATMDSYRNIIAKNAYEWSRNYSWNVLSERFLQIVNNVYEDKLAAVEPAYAITKE